MAIRPSTAWQWIAHVLILLICFLLLLAFAITWRTHSHVSSAGLHCHKSQYALCIEELTEASRWHLPYPAFWQQSAKLAMRFIDTHTTSEVEKKDLYWRLRAAIFESRNFLRDETKGNKSNLLQALDTQLGYDEEKQTIRRNAHTELNSYWQLASHLCFLAWILSTALTIFKGMNREAHIQWRPFLCFLSVACSAFAAWLFCLSAA